jgi:hypothetical protein
MTMKTTVRYEFDNTSFFPREFMGPRAIKFTDPSVIPVTGDQIHIRIEEFYNDHELISNYEDLSDGQVYYAERLNTIIGKETTEVIVVLYQEEVFKANFPRFF